jgi:hypothetical protein
MGGPAADLRRYPMIKASIIRLAKYIKTYIIVTMKPLNFVRSSPDDLRNFPDEARRAARFELRAVQIGL